MNDIIKETFFKVRNKPTKINKFYLIRRYLRMKYRLDISRSSLLGRLRDWSKEKTT